MMLETPAPSHQPPTPPASPSSRTDTSPSSSFSYSSASSMPPTVVKAELTQQANEVCLLVAKANQAPNGLKADELRRLLRDIQSLQLLAQQLDPSSLSAPGSASSPPPNTTAATSSWGISKKKPSHHSSVLCRSPTSSSTSLSSPSSPGLRGGCTPIRPRAHSPTSSIPSFSSSAYGSSFASSSSPPTCSSGTVDPTSGVRVCANCGTSNTVQWRCGADGKPSLCNACGLRYRYNLKKKALFEDIASVRAMCQRSPPVPQRVPPFSSRASPNATVPQATASTTPSLRPPATITSSSNNNLGITITSSSTSSIACGSASATKETSEREETRRSNIYSLLN